MVLGVISSCAYACFFPCLGIFVAKILFAMMIENMDEMKREVDRWCLWIFICAIGYFFVQFTKYATFGVIGENIILDMRYKLYAHILKMHLGWFDLREHSSGVLI